MAIKASDQISIIDLTDAFTVNLSMDSISLAGGTSTLGSIKTATVNVSAFCGATAITPSIGTMTFTDSTNVTAAVGSVSNNAVPITFTFKAALAAAGVVTIPVSVASGNTSVTIVKSLTYSISFTGATGAPGGTGPQGPQGDTGKGVASVAITYQAGSSNTTAPTGTWQSSPPSVSQGQYLWTKIVFTYTDNTTSDPMYSVARQGSNGTNGTNGTSAKWYTGTGITGTSTTAKAFSGSGVSSANIGDMYLNTSTYNTYRCTVAGDAATAKWVYVNNIKGQKGDTGNSGADAISIAVISSNGTIFKNTAVATTLTAHVYVGGREVNDQTDPTLSSLGTIKWYKDGVYTGSGFDGQTLTIGVGDVTDHATYVAQLEA